MEDMNRLKEIYNCVLAGDINNSRNLIELALKENINPNDIIENGFNKALTQVGIKFEKQEYFLPDMLASAMVVKNGMEIIGPLLKGKSTKNLGVVVMGTVEGDIHDVGKNIVIMMLENAGFKVHDLGIDVNGDSFISAIKKYKPDILGLSALLNITMQNMGKIIKKIENENMRNKLKIIVGGAPLNQKFADSIGADGYAPDASKAVSKVKELLNLKL